MFSMGSVFLMWWPITKRTLVLDLWWCICAPSGFRKKHWQERTFDLDPRTVKAWSDALLSGNGDRIERVLLNPDSNRKVSKTIEQFIRVRFKHLYRKEKYRYSSVIRSEIKEIYEVELSAETLSPLFQALKAEFLKEQS